jgi:pectinesterase
VKEFNHTMKKVKQIISIVTAFTLLVMLCQNCFAHTKIKRIVVDKRGGGDFTSIQSAINSLTDSSIAPRLIYIKNGTYDEKLLISKNNIILEGENRDKVVITQSVSRDEWRCKHPDDWGVATMNIRGNDITLENLTIENSYGFDNKTSRVVPCEADTFTHQKTIPFTGHQMALRTMGNTKMKAINVHFKSFAGDTVSPWNVTGGMFYFKDCTMDGGVDFYCPRGWAYAEDCKFYANTGPASIWQDGSANQDSKTVLKNCSFDGFKNFNLGRYHKDAQFYLVNCRLSKNMADRDIYLVPTSNIIKWGRRVYYYNCHRQGGDYPWFKNNLSSAKGSPSAAEISAAWVFGKRWDPGKIEIKN